MKKARIMPIKLSDSSDEKKKRKKEELAAAFGSFELR